MKKKEMKPSLCLAIPKLIRKKRIDPAERKKGGGGEEGKEEGRNVTGKECDYVSLLCPTESELLLEKERKKRGAGKKNLVKGSPSKKSQKKKGKKGSHQRDWRPHEIASRRARPLPSRKGGKKRGDFS